jgi:hypothetical protein
MSSGIVERTQRSDLPMTRDQRRSLYLGSAVADVLQSDPERVLSLARNNLSKMQSVHPYGPVAESLREWGRLLDGSLYELVEVLTSPEPFARELRQNSPFAGALTQQERLVVLANFRNVDARGDLTLV